MDHSGESIHSQNQMNLKPKLWVQVPFWKRSVREIYDLLDHLPEQPQVGLLFHVPWSLLESDTQHSIPRLFEALNDPRAQKIRVAWSLSPLPGIGLRGAGLPKRFLEDPRLWVTDHQGQASVDWGSPPFSPAVSFWSEGVRRAFKDVLGRFGRMQKDARGNKDLFFVHAHALERWPLDHSVGFQSAFDRYLRSGALSADFMGQSPNRIGVAEHILRRKFHASETMKWLLEQMSWLEVYQDSSSIKPVRAVLPDHFAMEQRDWFEIWARGCVSDGSAFELSGLEKYIFEESRWNGFEPWIYFSEGGVLHYLSESVKNRVLFTALFQTIATNGVLSIGDQAFRGLSRSFLKRLASVEDRSTSVNTSVPLVPQSPDLCVWSYTMDRSLDLKVSAVQRSPLGSLEMPQWTGTGFKLHWVSPDVWIDGAAIRALFQFAQEGATVVFPWGAHWSPIGRAHFEHIWKQTQSQRSYEIDFECRAKIRSVGTGKWILYEHGTLKAKGNAAEQEWFERILRLEDCRPEYWVGEPTIKVLGSGRTSTDPFVLINLSNVKRKVEIRFKNPIYFSDWMRGGEDRSWVMQQNLELELDPHAIVPLLLNPRSADSLEHSVVKSAADAELMGWKDEKGGAFEFHSP